MTREEVLTVITSAGLETLRGPEDFGESDHVLITGEWEIELRFMDDVEADTDRLLQLSVDEESLRWDGKQVIDGPLHEALFAMGEAARGAGWSPYDAGHDPFADRTPPGPGPYSDESLLREGTLWLPSISMGLVMCEGVVNELVWRQAMDVPTALVSPLTEAQLRLSQRPDLTEHLRQHWNEETKTTTPRSPSHPLQKPLTSILILAMAVLVMLGWNEYQRWQNATLLPAVVHAIDPLPGKHWEHHYRVEYDDPQGQRQTVTLQRADFYVTPRKVGEEVQVWYATSPPEAIGPSRARDAAFLKFAPRFIGVGLAYALASVVLGILARRKHRENDVV